MPAAHIQCKYLHPPQPSPQFVQPRCMSVATLERANPRPKIPLFRYAENKSTFVRSSSHEGRLRDRIGDVSHAFVEGDFFGVESSGTGRRGSEKSLRQPISGPLDSVATRRGSGMYFLGLSMYASGVTLLEAGDRSSSFRRYSEWPLFGLGKGRSGV